MYSLPQSYNQTSRCKRCICPNAHGEFLKEFFGMWVGKSENSSLGMDVLSDLKARRVQYILITCTDNWRRNGEENSLTPYSHGETTRMT